MYVLLRKTGLALIDVEGCSHGRPPSAVPGATERITGG